jgi:hypothetical protein
MLQEERIEFKRSIRLFENDRQNNTSKLDKDDEPSFEQTLSTTIK